MERSLKILLVEDDQNFGDVLKSYLEMHDYEVSLATDGVAGWEKFRKNTYDLCILDVMMPKKDGFTLGKEIREKDSEIPIIYLTAKTMKDDILQGFKMGADDYITKPFNTREVVARVKAVLRRSGQVTVRTGERLNYPDLMIDLSEYKVVAFGKNVTFTAKEMELLWCLASNPGLVFSRNQLLETIWGYTYYGDTRTVDTHIKRVRHKLDIPKDSPWDITTVWGVGYKFEVRK